MRRLLRWPGTSPLVARPGRRAPPWAPRRVRRRSTRRPAARSTPRGGLRRGALRSRRGPALDVPHPPRRVARHRGERGRAARRNAARHLPRRRPGRGALPRAAQGRGADRARQRGSGGQRRARGQRHHLARSPLPSSGRSWPPARWTTGCATPAATRCPAGRWWRQRLRAVARSVHPRRGGPDAVRLRHRHLPDLPSSKVFRIRRSPPSTSASASSCTRCSSASTRWAAARSSS